MTAIVILAGQSNMLGHGELSEIGKRPLPPAVRLFDLNPRDGCFGPEIGFAREIQKRLDLDDLWLVKYAVGGSSLLAWEPDWSPARAALADDADKGPLYQRLIEHFTHVTRDVEVEVLACLWMQGESDARYEIAAAQYQTNLTRFITRMREDLREPALRFVIGLINPWPARFAFLSTVRDAQRQVAKSTPNVSLVDTDGLSKHDDDLHYDTAGQLELGRRFARQLSRDLPGIAAAQATD